MKNVLWDLVRRWRWRALIFGLVYGAIVWSGVPDLSHWTAGFFPLALFLGMTQLSTELSHGDVPRVLRTLPVTAKEIGRAGRWACVGLPALTLGVITAAVFGAANFVHHHSFTGVLTPWNIPVHFRHEPLDPGRAVIVFG